MSAPNGERLYDLLPAFYRQRDVGQGEPLRALLAVLESELRALEADVDALYDNWFVETCDERTLRYIGDLLGIGDQIDPGLPSSRQRSHVANSIAYRRRKGVAAILERVAQDVTGWGAHAVEFFGLVGATQYVQHVRPGRGGTIDLRDIPALQRLGGPFDSLPSRTDVRRVAPIDTEDATMLRGKPNIPNVGLFVWRLESYPLTASPARSVPDVRPGAFTFDPRGFDVPLFNRGPVITRRPHRTEDRWGLLCLPWGCQTKPGRQSHGTAVVAVGSAC
jgi:hypothetical protein